MTHSLHFKPYQQFVQEGRKFWKSDLYADVMREAEGKSPGELTGTQALAAYSWFEKNLQQAKYYGPHGLVETFRRNGGLEQDRDFDLEPGEMQAWNDTLPGYYRDTGFHQHNPGVWPSLGDALAYEYATNYFSFSLIAADVPYKRVAEIVADLASELEAPRVMDLGAGYGKLAFAIKRAVPQAVVEGVDLSMPLIKLGQKRTGEMNLDVNLFCHQAEQIDQLGRSFDVITAYWLLHELPQEVTREVVAASYRALAPGGYFVSLDMHRATGGELGEFLQKRHGVANDEPFLEDLLTWDYEKDMAAIGYEDIRLIDPVTRSDFDVDKPLPAERTHEFSVLIGRKPETAK
ncbi:MAG: class I SAM-dependent methyltransferase [Nitratireductor sp.]|nr:class I SAM-dependent methyltransferase [Nitratireductor sp.]